MIVPSVELALPWAVGIAVIAGAGYLLMRLAFPELLPFDGPSREALLGLPKDRLLWVDVIILVHLVFTSTVWLLSRWQTTWRDGDPHRRLVLFSAPPPRWSHWFGALVLVATAIPYLPLSSPQELGSTAETLLRLIFGDATVGVMAMITAAKCVHGSALVALTSAALWSWTTWATNVRVFWLGRALDVGRLHASGSIIFIENESGTEIATLGGSRAGPWRPRSLMMLNQPGFYRGLGADHATFRGHSEAPGPIGRPRRSLTLPFSVSHWVPFVGGGLVITLLATIKGSTISLLLMMYDIVRFRPTYLIFPLCLALGLWRRESSSDRFALRTWNWPLPRILSRRFLTVVGCCLWTLYLAFASAPLTRISGPDGPSWILTPHAIEIVAVGVLLWIPFWLSFVEPRLFIRQRRGRLELRRLGAWLPLTDAYPTDLGRLVLATGPATVTIDPSRWPGVPFRARVLAEFLRPHLSPWSSMGEDTQGALGPESGQPEPASIINAVDRAADTRGVEAPTAEIAHDSGEDAPDAQREERTR